MRVRTATTGDASAIAAIYNQGIEERIATFETALRSDDDVLAWFDGVHPIVVVTDDADDTAVIAFARCAAYSTRECYRGIFDFAVYTDFAHRRKGAGMVAMRELVTRARAAGAWKLVSRIFVDNDPSRMLMAALGFREVGVHHRHARLEGKWRDVVVVEKFLAPTGVEASVPPPPPSPRSPREAALGSLRSADANVRGFGLDAARTILAASRRPDSELLEAVADACFASPRHEPSVRTRFVEVFRAYAALGRDSAREVDAVFFARLERLSVVLDLDGFYEAMFVARQALVSAGDPTRAADLATVRPRLLAWMREAIELPRTHRGRISPGNFASLVMALALAASETDAQKHEVAELAAAGRDRHRIDPPATLRPPSRPPPPPVVASSIPPPPSEAPPSPPLAESEPPATVALPIDVPVEGLLIKPKRKRAPADPTKPKPKRKSRAKPKASGAT